MVELKFRPSNIGLALSGGGVRAAAFHAGVLRYLAEAMLLEQVTHVSTVSGGSLLVGLLYNNAGNNWPSSSEYLQIVFKKIRHILTNSSLEKAALKALLLNPRNWSHLLSRANVLADAIRSHWEVHGNLGDLSEKPVWSINCTTAETGRRFRFKSATLGDYKLGYAATPNFPLAHAMATSAAYPGIIGPLRIRAKDLTWRAHERYADGNAKTLSIPFNAIHLYDGGIYDNLGMEPLFDVGKQRIKSGQNGNPRLDFLLVSDGGSPLANSTIPSALHPGRFKRIAGIALEQARALRVRSYVNFLQMQPLAGAYVAITSKPNSYLQRLLERGTPLSNELASEAWLSEAQCEKASILPTTLGQLTPALFDLLATYGYQSTKLNIEICPSLDRERDSNGQ